MSIEVTMRHSDVRIEALKEYAEKRMARLKQRFPKVTSASIVIDVDAKKHMYMAEVVANRLGETGRRSSPRAPRASSTRRRPGRSASSSRCA